MTISTTTRKAGPYAGNDVATSFAFGFKVFQKSDLKIVRTSETDVETVLVLDSDYSVTLNANQDVSPGGSVTYPLSGSPLAVGQRLTIVSNVPDLQQTDITNGSGFYPSVIENALDNSVILVQQTQEEVSRALTIPVSSPADVSTALPFPQANTVIGWNPTANALQNFDPNLFASVVSYGTAVRDLFTGDGTTTVYTLSSNPGALANLDVDLNGVTQAGGIDFLWTGGTTVTFTTAPPNGVRIQIRYMQGLPQGSITQENVTGITDPSTSLPITIQEYIAKLFSSVGSTLIGYIHGATNTVYRTIKSRLLDMPLTPLDFGADPTGATLSDTAMQRFFSYCCTNSKAGIIPDGRYDISQPIPVFGAGWSILGQSRVGTEIRQRTNNTPCLLFNADLANNFELGKFTLSHTNAQADPTQPGCGIYYDLPGTTGNGVFNAHYHDIFFVNCGRGFMSNPGKSFPVWGSVFERIYSQRGCTGSAFYFRPSPAQGQPNNCFRDCYFFANNVLSTEYAFLDTNAQDTVEIHNIEINEALLGARVARITESNGVIGAIKLETATYSQGGNVILFEVSNSRFDIGHMLFAVTDITNSTNLFCMSPNGGAGAKIGVGNFQYGFTFSRTAPTSGTFTALNATSDDKFIVRSITNPVALGYSSAVRLLDNVSSNSATGVTILSMTDTKVSADVGDANYTVAAYSEVTHINYASARTGNRTVTLPSATSDNVFNGLSYTLMVNTASGFTIDFGGVYTFPASKRGSATVVYRRSAWVLTNSYEY